MDEIQIEAHVAEYAARYSALISVEQAAEIANVSRKTIYHWSSYGLLDTFKCKRGRHLRLGRDGFVRFLTKNPLTTTA